MNKSYLILLTLLLSLPFTFPAEAPAEKTGAANVQKGLHEITIFYANDVRGETEPCG